MRIKFCFIVGALFSVLLIAGAAFATNITISDTLTPSTSGWTTSPGLNDTLGSNHEDQETEPGTGIGQEWDQEAFLQEGSLLSMVGGFDFQNGVNSNNAQYYAGDIFFDVAPPNALWGSSAPGESDGVTAGKQVANKVFSFDGDSIAWDYVMDIDYASMTYDVIRLDADSLLQTTSFVVNSSPWIYVSGGTKIYSDLSLIYDSGLTDDDTGFRGDLDAGFSGSHYKLTADISWLAQEVGIGTEFIAHHSISCGNDLLVGKGVTAVPEPTTILLSGFGLLGMGAYLRRRRSKKA